LNLIVMIAQTLFEKTDDLKQKVTFLTDENEVLQSKEVDL